MVKILLLIIICLHGLIHLLGFVKAFNLACVAQLTASISRPVGLFWLFATLLFILSAVLLIAENDWWWIIAAAALLISQVLIISAWHDAKFGTIPNIIILLAIIAGYGYFSFENSFRNDVTVELNRTSAIKPDLLTENDILHLPLPVQNYLRYSGVLNKPKLINMKIEFEGEMRDKGKDWFKFTTIQYNFFDEPARFFYMNAKMFGITVPGYHKYKNAKASMDIRLFGLFPVMKADGPVMDITETVTLFNDMCLMAPASLIDKRITWQQTDSTTAKAVFTNKGITISAILYFNTQGQLTDFASDDRTAVSTMKQYKFTTPIREYRNINGINIIKRGDAIWHYPEGEFIYGKFYLKNIEYNVAGSCP